ncbi:MAG: hypothetical protein MJ252_12375, partial [archaeon]|nr:hypothetical protein [archaeon]
MHNTFNLQKSSSSSDLTYFPKLNSSNSTNSTFYNFRISKVEKPNDKIFVKERTYIHGFEYPEFRYTNPLYKSLSKSNFKFNTTTKSSKSLKKNFSCGNMNITNKSINNKESLIQSQFEDEVKEEDINEIIKADIERQIEIIKEADNKVRKFEFEEIKNKIKKKDFKYISLKDQIKKQIFLNEDYNIKLLTNDIQENIFGGKELKDLAYKRVQKYLDNYYVPEYRMQLNLRYKKDPDEFFDDKVLKNFDFDIHGNNHKKYKGPMLSPYYYLSRSVQNKHTIYQPKKANKDLESKLEKIDNLIDNTLGSSLGYSFKTKPKTNFSSTCKSITIGKLLNKVKNN